MSRTAINFNSVIRLGALLFASSCAAAAAPFSADVVSFSYAYGVVVQQPDFSIPSGFPASHQDPASGWDLTWDALESPVGSFPVGGAWRMMTAQASVSDPAPLRALSSINGWNRPLGYPGYAPTEWTVVAELKNIANATNQGTFYTVHVGVGNYGTNVVGARIEATWFDGDVGGNHYSHVLAFMSSLSVPSGYEWDSGAPTTLLTDLNPGDTLVELKIAVTNAGQTFSSYYRLDNSPDWILAQTHTLPQGVGALTGFSDSHPYVSISNELAPVPESAPVWLMLLGLPLVRSATRRSGLVSR